MGPCATLLASRKSRQAQNKTFPVQGGLQSRKGAKKFESLLGLGFGASAGASGHSRPHGKRFVIQLAHIQQELQAFLGA